MKIDVSPRESTLILKGDFLRFTYIYIYIYIYIYVFCKNASASGVVIFEARLDKTRGCENVAGVDVSPLKRNVFEHAAFWMAHRLPRLTPPGFEPGTAGLQGLRPWPAGLKRRNVPHLRNTGRQRAGCIIYIHIYSKYKYTRSPSFDI